MKILLSGSTSFIGNALATELIGRGHEVYALIRPGSEHKASCKGKEGFHILSTDIKDLESRFAGYFSEKKENEGFDLCMHLAWEGVGAAGRMDAAIQERNIRNTGALLRLAAASGCKRFLFAGSQAEYGMTLEKIEEGTCSPDVLLHEEMDCDPISEYGKAKLRVWKEASSFCREEGMEYIHMRIFSTYGPQDHSTSLIASCIAAMREGRRLRLGACRQLWNYIYVEDCAAAIADLAFCRLGQEKERIVNIAGEDTRPLYCFAEEIQRIYQRKDCLCFEERPPGAEGTPFLNPSIEKLKKLTGFHPKTKFEKGIEGIEKMHRLQGKAGRAF